LTTLVYSPKATKPYVADSVRACPMNYEDAIKNVSSF